MDGNGKELEKEEKAFQDFCNCCKDLGKVSIEDAIKNSQNFLRI